MRPRSAPNLPASLVSTLIACAGVGGIALAQGERPSGAARVVKAFDFEERDDNPLPVPRGWIRAQEDPAVPRERPGFPIWNGGILDYSTPAYDGIGSVMLPTSGGSTALMLRHGELSIFPGADYLISAQVRTHGLEHARARIVGVFLDQFGNEIESTRTRSALVQTRGSWQQVSIEMEGVEPKAAFLRIELQTLQPEQQEREENLAFRVWEQDFLGAAWFDNLIIAQLPRLEITTGVPGNIVASDAAPTLDLMVSDLTGEHVFAGLRVFDVHDRLVDQITVTEGTQSIARRLTPDLPGYGWYRALLEIYADERLVGLRTLDFIWAPPESGSHRSGMFAIDSTVTEPKVLSATPALIEGAGVDRAALRVWDLHTQETDLTRGSSLFNAIDRLLLEGTQLHLELGQLPRPLAAQIASDPAEVLLAFEDPNGAWTGWGTTMLDRFGQRITTWGFGQHPSEEEVGALLTTLGSARDAISGFVPGPSASIPWPIDRPVPDALAIPGVQIQLIDDHSVTPEGIDELVEHWYSARTISDSTDAPAPKLALKLHPLEHPAQRSGTQTRSALDSLARKAISFWWATRSRGGSAQDHTVSITDAWWVAPTKRAEVMPSPELIVWRTLSEHLGGREAIEALDLVPGARMLVLGERDGAGTDQPDGGLVLWLDTPSLDPVHLTLPLAMGPVEIIDVLGNRTRVDPVATGIAGVPMHTIPITRSPVIVEGVNPGLVRFLSALRLTPDTLVSQAGLHDHELVVTNPWDTPISGRVYIVEPGGYTGPPEDIDRTWEMLPRVIPFDLPAGERRAYPVRVGYSLGELAGPKRLVFEVDLDADQPYPPLRVEREIELGLPGIEMGLTAQRNDAGVTVVRAEIWHTQDQTQYFELIAIAPGEPRIRRTINALQRDQVITREFGFTNAVPGEEIIVVLIPRDATTRLNKSVEVP